MFDIAVSEVLATVIIASAVLSKRDMPIIARFTGRALGRAMHYVRKGKDTFASVSNQAELAQLHKDLRSALQDVEKIKSEISGSLSIGRAPVYIVPEQPLASHSSFSSPTPTPTPTPTPMPTPMPTPTLTPTHTHADSTPSLQLTALSSRTQPPSKLDQVPSCADIVSESILERFAAKYHSGHPAIASPPSAHPRKTSL
ncbi:mitochondrial Sec-independent protein translocase protein TatB [Andalucia godoyi]|uniref:Mitochondrial Sec-independent protein translocase protein TatB n=1 Tax=Andalucia godoyi TaxID=505711 RepID=A0A8K0AHJ1_ANDGO|nr:mitochondrial Sec-independent protein translocase protein TatB [Andalucia godoyi]|eukprot:ANDGO_05561.mRNA.1 mitochondrial Sec-independent protein translocase protein TatB